MTIDPAVLELATKTLTEKQFEAWILETQGYGTRVIAYRLDISRTSATDRIAAAHKTLLEHGVRMTPSGHYYLDRNNP